MTNNFNNGIESLSADQKEKLLRELVFDYAEERVPSDVWYPEGQDRDIAINAFLAAGVDEMCQCEVTCDDRMEAREAYATFWSETDPAGWVSEAHLETCEEELKAHETVLDFAEKAKLPWFVTNQYKDKVAEARLVYDDAVSAHDNHT